MEVPLLLLLHRFPFAFSCPSLRRLCYLHQRRAPHRRMEVPLLLLLLLCPFYHPRPSHHPSSSSSSSFYSSCSSFSFYPFYLLPCPSSPRFPQRDLQQFPL